MPEHNRREPETIKAHEFSLKKKKKKKGNYKVRYWNIQRKKPSSSDENGFTKTQQPLLPLQWLL